MKIDPESLKGKLYLLIADKIVIGGILALAFLIYDTNLRNEEHARESEQALFNAHLEASRIETQLVFERARLVREFLPIIGNSEIDLVTRGYTLQSAILTESIDSQAAFQLGKQIWADGLSNEHFHTVILSTLPDGLPALALTGTDLWRTQRDLWSEREDTEQDIFTKNIEELDGKYSFWSSLLFDAVVQIEQAGNFEKTTDVARSIFGVTALLDNLDSFEAARLSQSSSRGLALAGSVRGLI